MAKQAEERIPYYLRKGNEYFGTHPSKKRNPYRYERLMMYKKLMFVQIKKEGWRV